MGYFIPIYLLINGGYNPFTNHFLLTSNGTSKQLCLYIFDISDVMHNLSDLSEAKSGGLDPCFRVYFCVVQGSE